ncbi:hypothetical protein NHQ30_005350 [Ciborinia camelliae]|nr:hypothetical protein NHQ30_005350 [Ciborinia camelliae]
MRFVSEFLLSALGICPVALAIGDVEGNIVQVTPATIPNLVGRQISSSISVSISGSTSSVDLFSSSTSSPSLTASSPGSSPLTVTSLTSTSTLYSSPTLTSNSTMTGYNMAITTIFTQPPNCATGGITEMALTASELWENAINPVPNSTLTSCFPSQFFSSVLATESGIPLPPFSQLICPLNWETYDVNATGFGLYAPNFTDTQRPGSGAICTSSIWQNVLIDITSYDSTALATIIPTSAPANGTLVLANAFEGVAATATVTTSTTGTSSNTTATFSSSVSVTSIKTVSSSSGA